MRIGILGSTRGSLLRPLVKAMGDQNLPATIEIVISNKSDAGILQQAAALEIPAQFINPAPNAIRYSREAYDQVVEETLKDYDIDFVILLGYMRILSAEFVKRWPLKIINTHPSLLPAFGGKMDEDVHRAVLAAEAPITGCTVHYVTAEVDAGPIIVQKSCAVLKEDTILSLKQRVQALEPLAIAEAILKMTQDS